MNDRRCASVTGCSSFRAAGMQLLFHMSQRIPGHGSSLPLFTLDPIRQLLQHSCRAIIVLLLGNLYCLWQFEALQLETVFPGCYPHYEERAQLSLPLPDALAQPKILRPRGAKFEKNAVRKRSHLVELRVDYPPKSIAALDSYSDVLRNRLSCKLSEQPASSPADSD